MNNNNAPSWYWKSGLHDAIISDIGFVSLEYDYTEKNPVRNCLTLQLDSRAAMFDTSIKFIKLYNAKILSSTADYVNWWWVSDSLKKSGSKYILTICVASLKQSDTLVIQFDDAEVIRRTAPTAYSVYNGRGLCVALDDLEYIV